MQYVDVINRAAQIFNWENVARYDYVFRQLMAAKPHRSWSKIYTQMWNLNLNEPIKKFHEQNYGVSVNHYNSSSKSNNSRNQKDSTCWRFNKGSCKFGKNCRFEHKCSYCGSTSHNYPNCQKRNTNSKKQDKSEKRD